jgi:mannitol/fructose-specific phosphotransferase system IIA component
VWSAVVSGNSKIKDILADTEGNRRQAIESAVAQLMEKTLSDPGFVAAMKIN